MKRFLTIFLLAFPLSLPAAEMNYDNLYNVRLVSDAFQARCFAQDEDGFIWIGTNKGLCCYDGYSVRAHYRPGSPDNVSVHSIALYGGDRLFLGTETGLMSYDIRRGSYGSPDSDAGRIVRSLMLDGEKLWMGTTDGLYVYDIGSGVSRCLLKDADVYSVARLRDRIFAGTRGGLYCMEAGSDTFHKLELELSWQLINALYADESDNTLWFGASGLYRLHVYSGKLDLVSPSLSAKTLVRDCDGNLVIGTDYGLVTVDMAGGAATRYTHNLHRHNSLSNNVVQSIFRDDNDNIWIGTDYGVSLARRYRSYEYRSITQFTEGGEGNQFFVLCPDRDGSLWMGGNNGVVVNPPGSVGEVLWFRGGSGRRSIAHNRVRDIYADRDGRLWLSSDGGLQLYDRENRRFIARQVVDPSRGEHMYWVYAIREDREGDFWFSTFNNGIYKVDGEALFASGESACSARYTADNGLSGDFITAMAYNETANAVYSLASNGYIDVIDCAGGRPVRLDLLGMTEGRVPSAMISGGDEYIWIGYSLGLIRYNTLDGSSSRVLFGNNRHLSVTCMTQAAGNVWVCTNEGVWVVSPDCRIIGNFNFEDRVFTSACWSPQEGMLFFGDSDGYASVSPEILGGREGTGRLAVSRISVNGREYVSPDGLLSRYARELVLRSDQNDISVEFADLSFSNASFSMISYRLGDGDPVQLKSGSNTVSLTGLRPGRYELSWSGSGTVGADGAAGSIGIRILRPPMASNLAICLYCLAAGVIVFGAWHYRSLNARLRKEREEKEQTLNRVEEKMRLYSDISHEFKTPLSMILAPVSKMLSEPRPERDLKDLRLIHDSAIKMNQLIHSAIEGDKNDLSMELGLARSKVELVSFIHTIFSVFEDNQKDEGKEFIFTSSVEKIYCMVDVVKFESIMNNLLSNACKYTSRGDSIIVSLSVNPGNTALEIKVSDTGQGISREDLPYIFHRFFRSPSNSAGREGTGIGLYLVRSYVAMHGGSVSVESEYGQGSTFTVTIPFEAVADDAPGGEPVQADERTGLPTVVIVEDNEVIAGYLMDLLYDHYRCIIALNGRTGLKLCRDLLPDLIITDIMMPVMDGIRMCAELRENVATASIPIIVLTAVEDKKYELFSAKHRIDAFITKPFDSNYILARVKGLIDKKLEMEKRIRMEMMARPGNIEAVSADEKLLSRLVDVIEEHITDSDFNVNALCGYMEMSSKQVYRKCVQLLNMTPVEYIRYVRLKKAAVLLEQHKFNVSEVMYMVGFNNHSYFSKCFLKEFGMSPQQYRAEHGASRDERD